MRVRSIQRWRGEGNGIGIGSHVSVGAVREPPLRTGDGYFAVKSSWPKWTAYRFQAETVVDEHATAPSREVLIALAGPATNLVLAGLAQAMRVAGDAQGPLDAFLL